MSAMHWEARRRQSALERRSARDQQQLQKTSRDTTESNSTLEQTGTPAGLEGNCSVYRHSLSGTQVRPQHGPSAGGQCPNCATDLKTSVRHGGKIPNRYSSLQYTQQW